MAHDAAAPRQRGLSLFLLAHGSGPLHFCGQLGWGGAKYVPGNIRPEVFAPNLSARSALNLGAALGRDFPKTLAPLIDSSWGNFEGSSHLRLTADSGASGDDWWCLRAHANYCSTATFIRKAMLYAYLHSIAI